MFENLGHIIQNGTILNPSFDTKCQILGASALRNVTDLDLPADLGALAVLLVQVGQHLRSGIHHQVGENSNLCQLNFCSTFFFSLFTYFSQLNN